MACSIRTNNQPFTREASGTSGMTAAMNGAINCTIPDAWIPEFAKSGVNSFVIPPASPTLSQHEQDRQDAHSLLTILEEIIPMYYNHPQQWVGIIRKSMQDVIPHFDSDRIAGQYYHQLYEYEPTNARVKTVLVQ